MCHHPANANTGSESCMTVPQEESYPSFKVCSNPKCAHDGAMQPISNFACDKTRKDGHNCQCKQCTRAKNAEWRKNNYAYTLERNKAHYEANREKCIAYANVYRTTHPERVRATKKTYRMTHPEKFREYSRRKYQRRGDEIRQKARAWHVRTKAERWPKTIIHSCRARAKDKGVPCTITFADLLEPNGKPPEYCSVFGIKLDYSGGPDRRYWASVDRIKPRLGYVPGNVRVISMAANMAKMDGDGDLF